MTCHKRVRRADGTTREYLVWQLMATEFDDHCLHELAKYHQEPMSQIVRRLVYEEAKCCGLIPAVTDEMWARLTVPGIGTGATGNPRTNGRMKKEAVSAE